MTSKPSNYHSWISGGTVNIQTKYYLDVKLPLEYRLMPEISIRSEVTVNYESSCGISAKFHYVI